MSERGEVLVALIKDKRDFAILQNQKGKYVSRKIDWKADSSYQLELADFV